VWHMKMRNVGSMDNRTQFLGNMKSLKMFMHEWTRKEDGDGDGPTRVEPYTPNTYSDFVVNLIADDANGIDILVKISKLLSRRRAPPLTGP
jgi:hypothetical protein